MHDSKSQKDQENVTVKIKFRPVDVQFQTAAALDELVFAFFSMQLTRAFVTDHGKLVGIISREVLRDALHL